MSRYNRINLDGKSITETRLVTGDTLPGSVVSITADKFAKYVTAGSVTAKLYVLGVDYVQGKTADDLVIADDTGVADYAETGRELATLVAASTVLVKDSPLTTDLDGVLKLATPATDEVVAYSQESLTVGESAELVRVRFA